MQNFVDQEALKRILESCFLWRVEVRTAVVILLINKVILIAPFTPVNVPTQLSSHGIKGISPLKVAGRAGDTFKLMIRIKAAIVVGLGLKPN